MSIMIKMTKIVTYTWVTHVMSIMTKLTNKINLYSSATWLSIVIDFLTMLIMCTGLITCQIGLTPMFISID
jgi:hypothetical protein